MTYARYSENLALRLNDHKWINAGDPLQQADWASYTAWIAAGNTPVDGSAGAPGLLPSVAITYLDARMARIGEDVLHALISKGVIALTDLPAASQSVINQRAALRAKIATE